MLSLRTSSEPAPNRLRTAASFEPASVMEFGFKLFQAVGPDTLKRRPPYIDSLTGGTASWFLLTDLRQYRDDELCDAEWAHNSDSGAMPAVLCDGLAFSPPTTIWQLNTENMQINLYRAL